MESCSQELEIKKLKEELLRRELQIKALNDEILNLRYDKGEGDDFELILNQFPDPIFILADNQNGVILFCNKAFSHLTGYTFDEAVLISPIDLAHPDYKHCIYDHRKERINGNKQQLSYEVIWENRNKELIWLSLESIVVNFRNAERSLVYAKDITKEKLHKEELIKAKNSFRALFADSKIVSLILDKNTLRIIHANTAAFEFFGYKEEEFVNEKIENFIDDKSSLGIGLLEKGNVKIVNHVVVTGEIRETEVKVSNISSDGDSVLLYSLIDMTSRNKLERALVESEAKYKAIVNNSYDGIYIYKDNEILYANRRMFELSGYEPQQFKEMDFWDIVHPDDKERLQKFAHLRYKGKIEEDTYQAKIICAKGIIKECEFFVTNIHWFGDYAVLGVVRDVSERIESERLIKENERFLSTLIGNLNGMVYRCYLDGEWTMVYLTDQINALTGYSKNEVLYNACISYNEIIHPEDRESINTTINESISALKKFSIEYRIVTKTGNVKWVWEQGAIIVNDQGHFLEGIITDITEQKENNLKLSKSEAMFRNLFNSIQSVVAIFDESGALVDCNPVTYETLKVTAKDKGKVTLKTLGIVKDKEELTATYKSAMNGEYLTSRVNIRISKESNIDLIVDINGIENNGKQAMLLVGHDITEQMRAQYQLEKSEEKFRYITENSIDIIWQVDHKMTFTYVSPSLKKILGYDTDHWIGKSIDQFMEFKDYIGLTREVLPSLRNPKENRLIRLEAKIRHGLANELVPMEIEGKVFFSQDEEFLGFHGTSRDVSERYAMIRALKENVSLYQAIFGNTGTATCITSSDGEIILANKEFVHLSSCDRYAIEKNMSINDFIPEIEKTESELRELITKQREFEFVSQEKRKIPVITSIQPIEESDNYVVSLLNISKRKEMESQLKRLNQELEERVSQRTEELLIANNAKSEFLANMNHEIRTPINAILGFAELLEKKVEDHKALNYLESILVSGRNLLSLINSALDLSKVEAGKLDLINAPVDIYKLINDTKQMFGLKAGSKNVTFEVDVINNLPKPWTVFIVDGIRLKQVLINLVNNAFKFTYKGSVKLKLHINPAKDEAVNDPEYASMEFLVEDTGVGIPEESLSKIFEPFTQIKNAGEKEQVGTGIGLSICSKLVKLMKGQLEVESELGIGSSFKVTFDQVLIIKEFKSKKLLKREKTKIEFSSARIMVVDDIKLNREYLKNMLNDFGFDVIVAKDGQEAIDELNNNEIDLIITDLKMPIKDGFELKTEIEKSPIYKGIPIIAATAMTNHSNLEKIKEYKFSSYLLKPFTFRDVERELMKFLPYENNTVYAVSKDENSVLTNYILSNNIAKSLKEAAVQKWKKLGKIQRHADVILFGNEIISVGCEHDNQELIKFGEEIVQSSNLFDVLRVNKSLKDFGRMLKNNGLID